MNSVSDAAIEEQAGNEVHSAPKLPPVLRRMVPRKRWDEMKRREKAGTAGMGIVTLALTVWALWDIKRRPADQIRGKKRTWAMVSLIQPFGALIYFAFGRTKPRAED